MSGLGNTGNRVKGQRGNETKRSGLMIQCRQLRDNQLQAFRIGFCESHYNQRDYYCLDKALRGNKSVTSVSVGYCLPRPVLLQLLQNIVQLPNLQSLSLAVNTSLPKKLFLQLISMPKLQCLELRNAEIQSSPWKRLFRHQRWHRKVVSTLFAVSPSIQKLRLVACSLNEKDIAKLCEWTRSTTLEELSLSCSMNLSEQSIEMLCEKANCKRLDLTCCDLDGNDALAIARSLPKSETIEELVTARNPLWGEDHGSRRGFDQLAHVALTHLRHWNVGFCKLSRGQIHRILRLLGHAAPMRVESLSMLGIPKNCGEGPLLEQVLRSNQTLKSLLLRPKGLFCPPKEEILPFVERGLADNYVLQDLQVGYESDRLDLYLGLNRAGRRRLREDESGVVDWADVLSQAERNPSVLFWLIQNGIGTFV